MWKKWYQRLANPQQLYVFSGHLLPWCSAVGVFMLFFGWGWGFIYAPADYQQGESYRIIYLHVPAAMWSMGIYAVMAITALVGLVWQWKNADLTVAAMAPVGAGFTFIALITGAFWGKPMWGAWWVWDARLTSELILFFLYVGIIALYNASDDRRLAGRAASILVLVGVVNLPIIHFSVQWWNTLHQGSSGILQQAIDPTMRSPLRLAILGYLFILIALMLMRLRNLLLFSERNRPWAIAIARQYGEKT
ncbi:MAG: Heme exporter protein C [Candidatus Erwinia impunctatus]|nr:Heme exporter protein C [Culicoides impunctatus]